MYASPCPLTIAMLLPVFSYYDYSPDFYHYCTVCLQNCLITLPDPSHHPSEVLHHNSCTTAHGFQRHQDPEGTAAAFPGRFPSSALRRTLMAVPAVGWAQNEKHLFKARARCRVFHTSGLCSTLALTTAVQHKAEKLVRVCGSPAAPRNLSMRGQRMLSRLCSHLHWPGKSKASATWSFGGPR